MKLLFTKKQNEMNIDIVELKAKMQADVSGLIDEMQEVYKVDRRIAHIIIRASMRSVLDVLNTALKDGAEKGAFGMLQSIQAQKVGAEAAMVLLEDETL